MIKVYRYRKLDNKKIRIIQTYTDLDYYNYVDFTNELRRLNNE